MQSEIKLCVICVCGEDAAAVENFSRSLFCRAQGVRLLLCGGRDLRSEISPAGEGNEIGFVACGDGDLAAALNAALGRADAPLVMFSVPAVTFAPGAAGLLSAGGAAVCNAAAQEKNGPRKLYRDNFIPHEAFAPAVGVNFVMRTDVMRANGLVLRRADALGFAALAAEYCAYDRFSAVKEVLIYGAELACADAESFSETLSGMSPDAGLSALTLLLWAYSELSGDEKEKCFENFSTSAKPFFENEACAAYALAAFGVDAGLLGGDCRAGDFISAGTNAMYKEVTLPILADDVVRDFYGGKLSFGTLKRSIAAWLYFKLYRMGGPAKKFGCAFCRKFIGGDLNV